MSHFDFLAQQQPTTATVRALWYLDHFHNHGVWKQGFAFERQLRHCLLDDSLASLHRIDTLLSQIRKMKPNPDTFFRQPENQQFYYLLTFYCGELLGKILKIAPVWRDWQTFIAEEPQSEKTLANGEEYEWVASYSCDGEVWHYQPLAAILARLFPEHYRDAEPSVFAAIVQLTHDVSQYDPNDNLPEPPTQGLHFNVQAALAHTPRNLLPYLQILPPCDVYRDDLMTQIHALPNLYNRGRVVWAALVQAQPTLFQYGNTKSQTAQIIYDKSGRTPISLLQQWANELFQLKNTQPEDPKLRVYVEHLNAEHSCFSGSLPHTFSHMPLYATSVLVWLPHLPNGILTLPIFPILLADDSDEVMILPAYYWSETQLYRDWLREQAIINEDEAPKIPRSSQETAPAFAQYVQKQPEFWAGYQELLLPQSEDLPQLGSDPIENETILYETDQAFINQIRQEAMSQYPRWQEWLDKPSEPSIQECMHHLQNDDAADCSRQTKLYARLRLLEIDETLAQWVNEAALPPLPHSKLLPKINAVLAHDYLNAQHIAKLVQFLNMQGYAPQQRNTTALLYLSYLYFKGKFVPQSIQEAANHLRYASECGDGRATQWLAELILYVPELTPYLVSDEISQQAEELATHYLNAMAEGTFQYAQDEFLAQQQAFMRHRLVQYELVRQKLSLAAEQGNPYAHHELRTLIQEKKLPEQASEPRLSHIALWLIHHFDFVPETFAMPPVPRVAIAPIQAAEPIEEDYEQPVEIWLKWMKWGAVAMLLVWAMNWFWHNSDGANAQAAERPEPLQASSSLPAAVNAAALALAHDTPFVLPVSDHEVSAARIENDVVMIDLIDKNSEVMSQTDAQSVYCSESAFDALRESKANVQFVVSHPQGASETIHLSSNCPSSSS